MTLPQRKRAILFVDGHGSLANLQRAVSLHRQLGADPAAFVGPPEAQLRVFQRAYIELDNRIRIFTSLRLEELDKLTLQRRLDQIGRVRLPSAEAS